MAGKHPVNGPKSVGKVNPKAIGIGGGPPRSVPSQGANKAQDIGLHGQKAATVGRGKKDATKAALSPTLSANDHGNVKGQSGQSTQKSVGAYRPGKNGDADVGGGRHGGHSGSMRALGSGNVHSSVKGHEHSGFTHSSKDR